MNYIWIRTLLVRMIFQYFNCYNGIPYSIYLNHHISRERKMNEDMHFKKSCKCNKTIESRTQSSKIFSFYSPFFLIPLKMMKWKRTVLIQNVTWYFSYYYENHFLLSKFGFEFLTSDCVLSFLRLMFFKVLFYFLSYILIRRRYC